MRVYPIFRLKTWFLASLNRILAGALYLKINLGFRVEVVSFESPEWFMDKKFSENGGFTKSQFLIVAAPSVNFVQASFTDFFKDR